MGNGKKHFAAEKEEGRWEIRNQSVEKLPTNKTLLSSLNSRMAISGLKRKPKQRVVDPLEINSDLSGQSLAYFLFQEKLSSKHVVHHGKTHSTSHKEFVIHSGRHTNAVRAKELLSFTLIYR